MRLILNRRTAERVILRYVPFEPGDSLDVGDPELELTRRGTVVVDEATPDGSTLAAMCRYHMATGGKRLRAILPLMVAEALGDDPGKLEVLLVQFANLYRGGERVQMSTRSGSFVTLRELRADVEDLEDVFLRLTKTREIN